MGKIKISLLIIIIVVIALIAVAVILMLSDQPGISDNKIKDLDIAKEIYGFAGEIKKIEGKTLTLAALIPLTDFTIEPAKTTIEITIDDQTRIARLKFPKNIQSGTKSIYPKETIIGLSDLKVGDNINISSKTNIYDNLKNGTDFVVNDIFITED